MQEKLVDLNVHKIVPLPSPQSFLEERGKKSERVEAVARSREEIKRVMTGEDDRFLLLVGPCSIHDEAAAIEYANKLALLADRVKKRILVVMRVYFEKPRTSIGWKGLINDPHLNGTFDVPYGLGLARHIMTQVVDMGLPVATEWLDPITPQYLADLVSWGAIGARTVESQTHRQLASGLSMPLGFKNGTGGSTKIAINAMLAAREPQTFMGAHPSGAVGVVTTKGNSAGHIVLRGSTVGPNYNPGSVAMAISELEIAGLNPRLVIDCSHDNAGKNHERQPIVFVDVLQQRVSGNKNIIGAMLESNLVEGAQHLNGGKEKLKHGQSITDPCVGWEKTVEIALNAFEGLGGAPADIIPQREPVVISAVSGGWPSSD